MKRFFILMTIACVSTTCIAQKADAAFVVGGSFVSDTQGVTALTPVTTLSGPTLQTDHHIFFEGTLGFRMLDAKVASLSLEVPVAGMSGQTLRFAEAPSIVVDHLSTVFVTPSLRFKVLPAAGISPWGSFGGGWAHYSLDSGGSSNKAALQFGGGLDFKTGLPLLGFRAEIRDFITGDPDLNVVQLANKGGLRHNNVLAGGGIVLRF
ncbi:MAG TPA: hypothetical protein VKH81_08075 [Candidatus Angelobacter sp.]|nr:hypothetical protein [Candidatus Angelobacter sp.]